MGSTESPYTTEMKLNRIAWLSKQDSTKEFRYLMHHFNEESLRECFNQLDGRKAVGTDGIRKEEYELNLNANIQDLISRMKRMSPSL